MFSVRHIQPTGEECLYLAKQVRYTPANFQHSPDSVGGTAEHVWLDFPDGGTQAFAWGEFFVMNETGKTVARYDLGGWPEQNPRTGNRAF